MQNKTKSKITLVAMLATVASANAADHTSSSFPSATTDSLQLVEFNPIVITGNGHRQLLKTSTTPVHVLSQRLIKEAGVTDFMDAMSRFMPQVSFTPNAMGSYIRLNGLGNKYVLILVNGKKLTGDIAGNVDLNRIDMSRVKRIEVLDGAGSSLYGSDAIGGVINIITEQSQMELVSATSDTRYSRGQFSQGVNLDVSTKVFDSHTSYFHQQADSYQNNSMALDDEGNEYQTIAPYAIGFNSNLVSQRFDVRPIKNLSLYAQGSYNYKLTDRPNTREDITGGSDYDIRSEGTRWEAGAKYALGKHALQFDFINDNYHYGNLYEVASKTYAIGDFKRSKTQKYYEAELKGTLHFYDGATTIVGVDWRNDFLNATSGDVDNHVHTMAAYVQHDTRIVRNLTATVGARFTSHGTFGKNFTPKVALMYSPGKLRFRAAYSRGFRAPGLDELYYHYFKLMKNRPVITFGNTGLKAENSHYASISAEYTDKYISLSVMGYMNFVNDMIVKETISVTDDDRQMLGQEFPEATAEQLAALKTYSRYINSDKGIVKGLQANLTANITSDLTFMASYAYTYGRTRTAGVWQNLERTFRNSFTGALNYAHTWRHYTLNVNLNGRFQSGTYYPSYDDAPGYGVVNLNTTHTFRVAHMFTLVPSIGIDNIFNKTDHRIDTANIRHALYSQGRSITLGLKVNFAK